MAPSAIQEDSTTYHHAIDTHHKPKSLAHVLLRTSSKNYKAKIDFYCSLLSAHIVHETPVLTFLTYDDKHHRIAIMQSPECMPKPSEPVLAGVDHMAFTYDTLTDLAKTFVSLKKKGIHPVWTVNHGPSTSIYFRDPNGTKIELQVDNFDRPQDADAFMKGPLFDMNPIGTDFDPDEWAAGILQKADAQGHEILRPEELKALKTRREIGERYQVPADFI